ncbi:MAG TPA: zinc ABC transporter substrate-binding protein [Mycobacteriales bacterium]|nr:zinc ABC transporter substrate-binding protein [Mycobacteriales bacterium]
MAAMRCSVLVPLLCAVALAAAGCSGGGSGRSANGRLEVVAGENFWGNLAEQIGGAHVDVTSLITNPDADPHLFEPGTSNGLAVATAAVVIVNGAGYDPFMDRLLAASPSSKRTVVRVSDVLHVTGSDPNPHLWYDAPRLAIVVKAIAAALSTADPANATAYRTGAVQTIAALQPLENAVKALKATDAGDPVAYTERVPGYLLAAAGLPVLTPTGFARSIEAGGEPSASDEAAMRELITGHRIKALIYNEQATSPITAQLQALAKVDQIPVVPVTETMPSADSFESWQLGQVKAITAALAS